MQYTIRLTFYVRSVFILDENNIDVKHITQSSYS